MIVHVEEYNDVQWVPSALQCFVLDGVNWCEVEFAI